MPASVSSITSLVTHTSQVLAGFPAVWGKVIALANPIRGAITAAIHLAGEQFETRTLHTFHIFAKTTSGQRNPYAVAARACLCPKISTMNQQEE